MTERDNDETDIPSNQSSHSARRPGSHREAERAFIRLPATIQVGSDKAKHVAFVRDISPTGCFFYCDVTPEIDARIELTLEYSKGKKKVRLQMTGKVDGCRYALRLSP